RAAELVARALNEREHQLVQRELRVDAMAAAIGLVATVEPVDSLPAEPFRRQLEALVIDSGDDVEDVARAHGIDPAWASAVGPGARSRPRAGGVKARRGRGPLRVRVTVPPALAEVLDVLSALNGRSHAEEAAAIVLEELSEARQDPAVRDALLARRPAGPPST